MEIDRPIVIVLLLVIIISLFFFLILPKHYEFKILQQKTVEKEAEFKAKSEYYFRIEDLFEDLKRREEQLIKIDTAISAKPDFSSLLHFLQKVADERGVILTSLNFEKSSPLKIKKVAVAGEVPEIKEEETGIQENLFNFNIMGTYSAFKNFLSALESSARLIEVESISLSSVTPDEETEIKSFEFKIKVYSL